MSTSKVISCKTREDCKPWRAPNLNASEETVFDYKLTEPEKATHRSQQQKIRQQAYEKSYAKGYMEGLAQGKKEIDVQLEFLNSIMTSSGSSSGENRSLKFLTEPKKSGPFNS